MADMDMYAEVLRNALAQGKRVAPGVHLYLQFGSQKIKQYARERGYIELFEQAGAEMIDPSCGACINAGPGASPSAETVTVSAQNRNFPGRSGPGKLYLASPYVVAASAIAGKIVEPYEFLREPEAVALGLAAVDERGSVVRAADGWSGWGGDASLKRRLLRAERAHRAPRGRALTR